MRKLVLKMMCAVVFTSLACASQALVVVASGSGANSDFNAKVDEITDDPVVGQETKPMNLDNCKYAWSLVGHAGVKIRGNGFGITSEPKARSITGSYVLINAPGSISLSVTVTCGAKSGVGSVAINKLNN